MDARGLVRLSSRHVARVGAFVSRHAAFVLAGLALIAAYAWVVSRPLDDALAALRSHALERAPVGDLLIVEIDSESLRTAGEWPWPRAYFARAISNLQQAGAQLIGFDVDFSVRSSPDADDALRAAVDLDPGVVILPTFLQRNGDENRPLSALSRDAVLGSVNVPIDPDGRVRRYARGFVVGDRYQPSMAAVLAGAAYGDTSQFMIDYGIRVDRFDRLSFQDVLRGDFDPARVRGKIVLVGATALELGDEFATPVSPSMPGVYVHALAYESLARGRALTPLRDEVLLLLALAALALLWPRRVPLDLGRVLARHSVLLAGLLMGPILLQMLAPVSIDVGLILMAQLMCVGVSVHRELAYRASELIRQREAHLAFVASHDPETDLPNRRAMLEEIKRLSQSSAYTVVVVAAIDRFSVLRGAVGYGNANRLVCSLSEKLRELYGGAEVYHISTSSLGVVLRAENELAARRLCQVAREWAHTSVILDGQEIDASIRTGAACETGGAVSPETLLERASLALDQAVLKGIRHNTYVAENFPDPRVQLALLSDVAGGLARNEFSLRYQAKANIRTREVIGAEALMRWQHPVHGQISPERFIPVAEETGAIDELTRWALTQAVADQTALRSRGVDAIFSVNVSGRSLTDAAFCSFAIETVRRASANICLEITETAIIDDPRAAMASISAFRAAGLRISIDDYGAGLSSLTYLKQIHAHEIKLDKSLLDDLVNSARNRLILKSTIELAHALDMSVVAEGVEDEAALAVLAAMNCDSVQGFFIARPEELEGFERMWRASRRLGRGNDVPMLG